MDGNSKFWLDGRDRTQDIQKCLQIEKGVYEVTFRNSTRSYRFTQKRFRVEQIAPGDSRLQLLSYFKRYEEFEVQEGRKKTAQTVPAEVVIRGLESIDRIDPESVLADYVEGQIKSRKRDENAALIFPFGCNQSQSLAVKTALANSVSVIQGPPGTGKTQTILNLIANLLVEDKTIAVVSNNNDAVQNVKDKLKALRLDWLVADLGNVSKKRDFFQAQPKIDLDVSWSEMVPAKKVDLDIELQRLEKGFATRISRQQIAEEEYQLGRQLSIFLEEEARDGGFDIRKTEWIEALSERSIRMLAFCEFVVSRLTTNSGIGLLALKAIALLLNLRRPLHRIQDLKKAVLNALVAAKTSKRRSEMQVRLSNMDKNQDSLRESEKQFFSWSKECLFSYIYERFKDVPDQIFEVKGFGRNEDFYARFPVVTSTTYTLFKNRQQGKLFDWLIIDEASQVNLPAAAVCFSCARNVVIVGDDKQLPAILATDGPKPIGDISQAYDATQKNILTSVMALYGKRLPMTTLREHYRCHPDIISFCNKQFYGGQLVPMTSREGLEDAFAWIDMTGAPVKLVTLSTGEKSKVSLRQVQQVKETYRELLAEGISSLNIGVISPYRGQVNTIQKEIPGPETATVHKFQGREKDAVIYSAVTNQANRFSDQSSLLNVAVSRAKNKFVLISSDFEGFEKSNLLALVRYIKYLDPEERRISKSKFRSVFDSLFTGRLHNLEMLPKESPAEALFRQLLVDLLSRPQYRGLSVVREYPLYFLPRDFSPFSAAEKRFMLNNARLDFLIFDDFAKQPLAAIEVDGKTHASDPQKRRDRLKESILGKLNLPLQRFATRSELGGEKEIMQSFLESCLTGKKNSAVFQKGRGLLIADPCVLATHPA